MDDEGNLSIEASLIMPIIITYVVLIISIGVFIYENGVMHFKKNNDIVKKYQIETNDEFIKIGEGNKII